MIYGFHFSCMAVAAGREVKQELIPMSGGGTLFFPYINRVFGKGNPDNTWIFLKFHLV